MKTSTYIKKGTVALAIFTITLLFSMFIFFEQAFSITEEPQLDLPEVDKSIQADLPAGNYYISASYNNWMVLDVTGGGSADCTNIELFSYNLSNAQRFKVFYDDKGYATIMNASGKVLDVSGGQPIPQSNVIQFKNNNTPNQKWIISKDSSGYFKIKSALSEKSKDDLCLDIWASSSSDGANIQIFSSTNNKNQRFNFIPIESQKFSGSNELEDGTYFVKMKSNQNYTIEVNASSPDDCANVQLWSLHGSQNQIFQFTYEASTGCYIIYNVNSAKVLNVEKSNPFPTANVIQFKYTNDDNERWALTKRSDDGSWVIRNRHTGLVLDIEGARAANGTNISTYASHNGNSQRISIEKTDLLTDGIYNLGSSVAYNRAVEVPASSWKESEQLVTFTSNSAYNQKYSIKKYSNDEFTMRSLISGKLIAQKNNKVIQTNVEDNNSKWRLVWTTGGVAIQNIGNGLYMDVSGSSTALSTPIITKSKDSSKGEIFRFVKTDFSSTGTYNICPECNLNNSLNVKDGSWRSGAQIFSWKGYNDNNCKWDIELVRDGVYRIVSDKTGHVVDVKNGACHNYDQIQQYTWNGGNPQLWKIEFTDDGYFNFVNLTSGYLLDCFNESTVSGAAVGICKRNKGDSQKWRLHHTTSVSFSGNSELDAHLKNICRSYPDLPSVYNYISGFAYRDGDLWPGGDWTIPYALEMIYNGSGNCYRYAALFMWCARALGYSANAICGELATTGGGRQAHGWVEVYSGGTYVCDPELQHVLGQYNFYMITYDTAPVIYYK